MASLSIKRVSSEDIASIPSFSVDLCYFGHVVLFEDIYFDELDNLSSQLQKFERIRKGTVLLDGGLRFKLWLKATAAGSIVLSFRTEQFEPIFPGQCVLEGCFLIESDSVQKCVNSFDHLFNHGVPVRIERADNQAL